MAKIILAVVMLAIGSCAGWFLRPVLDKNIVVVTTDGGGPTLINGKGASLDNSPGASLDNKPGASLDNDPSAKNGPTLINGKGGAGNTNNPKGQK